MLAVDPPKSGSLLCNIWKGTASDLLAQDYLAVVPLAGWWKELGSNFEDKKARYALVISIFTEKQEIDIYSEVANIVNERELDIAESELNI